MLVTLHGRKVTIEELKQYYNKQQLVHVRVLKVLLFLGDTSLVKK